MFLQKQHRVILWTSCCTTSGGAEHTGIALVTEFGHLFKVVSAGSLHCKRHFPLALNKAVGDTLKGGHYPTPQGPFRQWSRHLAGIHDFVDGSKMVIPSSLLRCFIEVLLFKSCPASLYLEYYYGFKNP